MKILVFPFDKNPYQKLLYSRITNQEVKYLQNPTKSHIIGLSLLPFQLLIYRLKGFQIFHLHWFFTFQITVKNNFFHLYPFRLFFTFYFILFLLLVKLFNYKLIWTAHDIVSHEKYFINDLMVSKILSKLANGIIVHSESTKLLMSEKGFKTNKIKVISIGNYIDVYPNTISRNEAKSELNISHGDFVFGFIGMIESYKGVDELIKSFDEINISHTCLLIAGQCRNSELARLIEEYTIKNSHIKFINKYLPDEQIQIYMNASDIFVYPFKKITTSSSIVLAFSFRRTVIAPLIGEIIDLPSNTGLYYKPVLENNTLKRIMNYAANNHSEVKKLEQNAYEYIKSREWKEISKLTVDLYRNCLLGKKFL